MFDPRNLGAATIAEAIAHMTEMNAGTLTLAGETRAGKPLWALVLAHGEEETAAVLAAVEDATDEDQVRASELESAVLLAAHAVEDEANDDTLAALRRAVAERRAFLLAKKERELEAKARERARRADAILDEEDGE